MEDRKLRARFKNAELDAQLEKDGYLLIRSWVDKDHIAKMREVFDEFYKAPDFSTNLFNTLIMVAEKERKMISDRLMELLKPFMEQYLYNYEPTFGYFQTKPVNKELRELPLHGDSSAVNEAKYDYHTIWLPLVDVDKNNGCIYLIPGSRRLFTYEQPFAILWPYPHLEKQLKK